MDFLALLLFGLFLLPQKLGMSTLGFLFCSIAKGFLYLHFSAFLYDFVSLLHFFRASTSPSDKSFAFVL